MDLEARLAQLEDVIRQVVGAVREVCQKVAAIDEEVDKLAQAKVYERLDGIEGEFGSMVGGLNDIIDGRRKREWTDKIRSSRPEFAPYEGIMKEWGVDLYDDVANKSYEYPDEEREGVLAQMLEELKTKLGKFVSLMEQQIGHEGAETPAQEKAEQGEGPDGGEVEITVEAEKPKPGMIDAAKRFRGVRAG